MTSRTEHMPLWADQDTVILNSEMDAALRRYWETVAKGVGEQIIKDGGSAEDGLVAERKAWLLLGLGSPGTESSSSTSSASSPQSGRSGTSLRSLPGLVKSWLGQCLPYLLAATSESIRRRLVLSSASSAGRGKSKP